MKADYVLLLAHFTLRGGTDLHTYIPTHTHTHAHFLFPVLLFCAVISSSLQVLSLFYLRQVPLLGLRLDSD